MIPFQLNDLVVVDNAAGRMGIARCRKPYELHGQLRPFSLLAVDPF
jgi:hypothetical protein